MNLRPSAEADPVRAMPWWLPVIVIIGALLMVLGGVIALVNPAMLVSPTDEINSAVKVYAGYLVSRNVVLGIMLLVMLGRKSGGALATLMVLTAFIQIADACLDAIEGRWTLVPGVLLFGILFFVGAARVSDGAFWRTAAKQQP